MPHARGLPSRRAGAVRESGHGGMVREAPGLAVSHQGRTGLHGQRDRHVQDDAVLFGPVAVDDTPEDVTYGPQCLSPADRGAGGDVRVPAPLVLRRQVDGIADLALFPVRQSRQGRQQLQMSRL